MKGSKMKAKKIKTRAVYKCDECGEIHLKRQKAERCCLFAGCEGCANWIYYREYGKSICEIEHEEYCGEQVEFEYHEDEHVECHGSGSGMYDGDSFASGVFY